MGENTRKKDKFIRHNVIESLRNKIEKTKNIIHGETMSSKIIFSKNPIKVWFINDMSKMGHTQINLQIHKRLKYLNETDIQRAYLCKEHRRDAFASTSNLTKLHSAKVLTSTSSKKKT